MYVDWFLELFWIIVFIIYECVIVYDWYVYIRFFMYYVYVLGNV